MNTSPPLLLTVTEQSFFPSLSKAERRFAASQFTILKTRARLSISIRSNYPFQKGDIKYCLHDAKTLAPLSKQCISDYTVDDAKRKKQTSSCSNELELTISAELLQPVRIRFYTPESPAGQCMSYPILVINHTRKYKSFLQQIMWHTLSQVSKTLSWSRKLHLR